MMIGENVTVFEAAALLNVSERYVTTLLDRGVIQHVTVDGLRYVHRQNLMAFKAVTERRRSEIMQELADQAQREDMGY